MANCQANTSHKQRIDNMGRKSEGCPRRQHTGRYQKDNTICLIRFKCLERIYYG